MINKKIHDKLVSPMLDKYEIYTLENLESMEDFVLSFEKDIEKIIQETKKELLEEMYEKAKSKPYPNHTSLWDFENQLKKLTKE